MSAVETWTTLARPAADIAVAPDGTIILPPAVSTLGYRAELDGRAWPVRSGRIALGDVAVGDHALRTWLADDAGNRVSAPTEYVVRVATSVTERKRKALAHTTPFALASDALPQWESTALRSLGRRITGRIEKHHALATIVVTGYFDPSTEDSDIAIARASTVAAELRSHGVVATFQNRIQAGGCAATGQRATVSAVLRSPELVERIITCTRMG